MTITYCCFQSPRASLWCQQIHLGKLKPGPVSGARALGTDSSWTAPHTYRVSHERSLQNLPEHLIRVTLKGIQVVPAGTGGRESWISEDERFGGSRFSAACGEGRSRCVMTQQLPEQCLAQDDGP